MHYILTSATVFAACALGLAAVIRKPGAAASWCFLAGLVALAGESALGHYALQAVTREQADERLTNATLLGALVPGIWIIFSLIYCRGNARKILKKWKFPLAASTVLPIGIAVGFRSRLVEVVFSEAEESWWIEYGEPVRFLTLILLLGAIAVLVNLEKTFRSAAGTERWRIKYMILGLGLIFGVRIYTLSQRLLYTDFRPSLGSLETVALLIGCILMTVAYLRKGFGELKLQPSQAVLRGSLTIILAGIYFAVVGVLAQVVAALGGAASFPGQAFLVLVGIVVLAVVLLSDRFRTRLRRFVTRHFRRPQYDFRQVWTKFTNKTSHVMDRDELCRVSAKLITETLDVLTVSLFVFEGDRGRLVRAASTFEGPDPKKESAREIYLDPSIVGGMTSSSELLDLDEVEEGWAEDLRNATPIQFQHGGHRVVLPLATGEQVLGLAVLGDRVGGVPYTQEEEDLLGCIAGQIAAGLLNRNLAQDLMEGKEIEAFQTISTFFVHDLKNAANSLTLMLQNLPDHFDDPEFRQDALRGIGKTVDRINSLIQKLGSFRQKLEITPVESDLNLLVEEVLHSLNGAMEGAKLVRNLGSLPKVVLDPEQMQSVVTNLLMNAREAVGEDGKITVETRVDRGNAILFVADNGCGMDPEYMKESLFRPFRTTKSKGLGIGIFQSKLIVEAHHGTMRVESEPGKGTTFEITIPAVAATDS